MFDIRIDDPRTGFALGVGFGLGFGLVVVLAMKTEVSHIKSLVGLDE